MHIGLRGHDGLPITSSHRVKDGKSIFLELPDLQPVNQLHLQIQTGPAIEGNDTRIGQHHCDLYLTVHALDEPFTNFPGYQVKQKELRPHPMVRDLASLTKSRRNPHQKSIPGARMIEVETAGNLTYVQRQVSVRAGEAIQLVLINSDVVPHNWALLKPGTLASVGGLANKLITDPEAAAKHYIPDSDDVLAYTEVVEPHARTTIYFRSPETPGRYPYLCTFPGHWMVMNGELVVE
jgi:azurin